MSIKQNKPFIFVLAFLVFISVLVLVYFQVFSPAARFERLVGKADACFASGQFEEAGELYHEALKLRPGADYPVSQALKTDSISTANHKARLYKLTLSKADSLFVFKDYVNARASYLESLQFNPGDDYPVHQLKLIESILAEESPKDVLVSGSYHIVAGVFDNIENAEKMVQQLKEKGLNPLIIHRPESGMKAVAFGFFTDIHQAYNNLAQARREINTEAWVIYHREK
ncbi:MAG: SPOR domain-containing protein [Bacteroidales bacterium]|nr:SPOR domain-containing protein [Bacteroidales bacterium]